MNMTNRQLISLLLLTLTLAVFFTLLPEHPPGGDSVQHQAVTKLATSQGNK